MSSVSRVAWFLALGLALLLFVAAAPARQAQLAALRAKVDAEALTAAWAEGRAMTMEEALAVVRATTLSDPPTAFAPPN